MVNQHSKAYFNFPDIPDWGGFSFEKLSSENFQQLYLLFEADDSPFTDRRFKHYTGAEQYALELEQFGKYSAKHGGQDWLVKFLGEYIGILHLYDMSLETFGENNKRCWIGFATRSSTRQKGLIKKAVNYFLKYIFDNYENIWYIHAMTLKNNFVAKAFLKSIGFKKDPEERISKQHDFYLITRKE